MQLLDVEMVEELYWIAQDCDPEVKKWLENYKSRPNLYASPLLIQFLPSSDFSGHRTTEETLE